jgi:hypothetical protein
MTYNCNEAILFVKQFFLIKSFLNYLDNALNMFVDIDMYAKCNKHW